MIALIDRLAAYAAREAENDPPEEIKRQEEEASRRLAEKVRLQRLKITNPSAETDGAFSESESAPEKAAFQSDIESSKPEDDSTAEPTPSSSDAPAKKFRGIPEDVRLFEMFWQQVVDLIKVSGCKRIRVYPLTMRCFRRRDRTYRFKTLLPF